MGNLALRGAVVAVLAVLGAAASAPVPGGTPSTTDDIYQSFDRGDYQRAAGLIENHLKFKPNDGPMLYNAACAHCRLGKPESAAAYLMQAVKAGFHNFSQMRRDADLRSLRDHPKFRALLDARDAADSLLAARRLEQWKANYRQVQAYRYATDPTFPFTYVTALDEAAHDAMVNMLSDQARHMIELLFESPPRHHVLIALPTSSDAATIFDDQRVHGNYKHESRLLISADAGSSLRHEFVHVFHHAHMDAIGQEHPIWVQEGLASLFEDYALGDDGSIEFAPNQRRNMVKAMARNNRLIAWSDFFRLKAVHFNAQPAEHYAQARSIFEFLADEGKLKSWYRAFRGGFDNDPLGFRAFEAVFGKSSDEVERQWREWLNAQPTIVCQDDLPESTAKPSP
ncbi:MAG: hypothetical protein L0219_15860 [Phycisphaerales bacterium]|nr:hypothetical protein [Phycisphaerales bacterium]